MSIFEAKANSNKINDMGGFLCCLKINSVIFHSPCCFDKWIKRKDFTESWIKICPKWTKKFPH